MVARKGESLKELGSFPIESTTIGTDATLLTTFCISRMPIACLSGSELPTALPGEGKQALYPFHLQNHCTSNCHYRHSRPMKGDTALVQR